MGNDGRILLVDDVPGERANFAEAFESSLDVAAGVPALDRLLQGPTTWDAAFVDFNLSSGAHTGLSALLRLRQDRPHTEVVTYSQFSENGRTLYAAAARHWLGCQVLLDKTRNDPATLRSYLAAIHAGTNPTPLAWQRRLQWAHLVDSLLAEPSWVQMWQALRDAAGEMSRVAGILGVPVSALRGFKERATDAAIEFNTRFHDIPHPGDTRNKKGILSSFAAEHWQFLTAPDLAAVMSETARPGAAPHRPGG
jgi:CheY-like chemotaxis protein